VNGGNGQWKRLRSGMGHALDDADEFRTVLCVLAQISRVSVRNWNQAVSVYAWKHAQLMQTALATTSFVQTDVATRANSQVGLQRGGIL